MEKHSSDTRLRGSYQDGNPTRLRRGIGVLEECFVIHTMPVMRRSIDNNKLEQPSFAVRRVFQQYCPQVMVNVFHRLYIRDVLENDQFQIHPRRVR